jgi:SNF2 family DNA or RNA helicase
LLPRCCTSHQTLLLLLLLLRVDVLFCVPQVTRSSKVLHLIRRLIEVGIYTPPAQQQQQQQQQQQPIISPQLGTNHTSSSTAAAAGAAAVVAPGAGAAAASTSVFSSSSSSGSSSVTQQPVKAIVFSQFWMHVQLIAAELAARGVRHVLLKRDMPARDKQAAVTSFRAARAPCCMLMDESGEPICWKACAVHMCL